MSHLTSDFKKFCEQNTGRRVFYRGDFNVPMQDGVVSDDTRLSRSLPGIVALHKAGLKLVLASHLGRPDKQKGTETNFQSAGGKGTEDSTLGLLPIAKALQKLTGFRIRFCPFSERQTWAKTVDEADQDEVILLDNLRFFHGETKNDDQVSSFLASLADVYVNDAFACCHRAHASIVEIALRLPSTAGPLITEEIAALRRSFDSPPRNAMAIVGGAKVSTKIDLLSSLADRMDVLLIGGGMANTLLSSVGVPVGRSLCEVDCLDLSKDFMKQYGDKVCLPKDVIVAPHISRPEQAQAVDVNGVAADQAIFDVGPLTIQDWLARIDKMSTVFWNGPLGVIETPAFANASIVLATRVAARTDARMLDSVAGGGDTLALLRMAGVMDKFAYVSTAGGAFLEYIEGRTLPGLAALGLAS